MPSRIYLDPGMKMAYKGLFNIDPDECELVAQPFSEFEISLEGKRKNLGDFIQEAEKQLVTVDMFSTKEINDQAIKQSRMPESEAKILENLYIEFQRQYAIIKYGGKKIGIGVTSVGHNGIPQYVSNEELVRSNNPGELYSQAVDKFLKMPIPPKMIRFERFAYTDIAFQKNFLNENPISKMGFLRRAFAKKKKVPEGFFVPGDTKTQN